MTFNAFTLPPGKVQICFSGGRTSAFMLHEILESNGGLPDRCQTVFANTGREFPQTLAFVQDVSHRWRVPITWVEWRREGGFAVVDQNSASRNGEPFEALIEKKKYLPNQQARFCTSELKVRAARDYLRALGWDYWTAAVGIRADEPHRTGKADLKERWTRWTPLVSSGVTKRTVALFWSRQPFDLQLPHINGKAVLGNCDGCFLKSERTLAMLARDYPDRPAWWEQMEARVSGMTAKPLGARFRKEFSRQELRQFVDAKGPSLFERDGGSGLLCQATHGECT